MEVKEILSKCDHTLLAQTATWKEIRAICDDGMKYGCASVCIPASYVKQAAEYVDGKLTIEPAAGAPYVDRSRDFPMKIDEKDLACIIFAKYGFEWGGSWEDRKDYQHFEIPDDVIKNW